MNQPVSPQAASLAPVLHARALAAGNVRLVLDIVLGSAAASVAFWFRPVAWLQIASAGLCFAMYGVWAFAERRIERGIAEFSVGEKLWMATRRVSAVLGLCSAATLACSVAAAMLGTWIS